MTLRELVHWPSIHHHSPGFVYNTVTALNDLKDERVVCLLLGL